MLYFKYGDARLKGGDFWFIHVLIFSRLYGLRRVPMKLKYLVLSALFVGLPVFAGTESNGSGKMSDPCQSVGKVVKFNAVCNGDVGYICIRDKKDDENKLWVKYSQDMPESVLVECDNSVLGFPSDQINSATTFKELID